MKEFRFLFVVMSMLMFTMLVNAEITADSTTWENSYEADASPDTVGWTVNGTAPTVAGGIAKLDTFDDGTTGWWSYDAGSNFDFSTGATLEIRAKVNEWQGGATTSIYVADTAGRLLFMEPQAAAFNFSGLGLYAFDTTDDFHTYRIAIGTGTDEIKLYIDDVLTPVYTRTYGGATAAAGTFRIGDLTAGNDADWDIDYIRWTDGGSFAPPQDPITADSSTWEGSYEADVLPSEAGWLQGGPASTYSTVSNGILTLNSIDFDTSFNWTLTSDAELDFINGSTVEFRAKMISQQGAVTAAFYIYDKDGKGSIVDFRDTGINLYSSAFTTLTTTDDFHIYRICYINDTFELYVDNNFVAVTTVARFTGLDSAGNANKFNFGDATGGNDSNWELDYVRWTNSGAIAPEITGITADSTTWEYSYEADAMPDTDGWFAAGAAGTYTSVDNGIADFNSLSYDTSFNWESSLGSGVDFSEGASLEFKAKLNHAEGSVTAVFCMFDKNDVGLYMGLEDNVFNFSSAGTHAMDTTDDFHVYRITMGATTAKLYVDGAKVPNREVTYPAGLTGLNRADRFFFGDITGTNDSAWQLDYVRWTAQGQLVPPELCGDALHQYPIGDLNFDCLVNSDDIVLLVSNWLYGVSVE
ncbi:MAG: hypothetical protein ACIAQZ_01345 [Sedimentisphaeraceae bacterium JB056]